jgi:rhodanese-related sulfurtransferase
MKVKFTTIALIGLGILLAIVVVAQVYAFSGTQMISATQARRMQFDKIVDVRTDFEWSIGHHPQAVHIPILSLTAQSADAAGLKKGDRIMVYCNTGQRSRRGAELLKSFGYEKVYYITGSYVDLLD